MNKRLGFTSIAFLVTCISANAGTYEPQFQVDYNKCGQDPLVNDNSVQFGRGDQSCAGRVVSTKRYKNIMKVTATIDLSALKQNYVNAAFYMVENNKFPEKRPFKGDYCDSGGSNNHDDWNCREIDFLETNGNKIFQTTMHLGNGGRNAPQRYEYAFTSAAQSSQCFNWKAMKGDPKKGLIALPWEVFDVGKPFSITTEFTYSPPRMKTTVKQTTDTGAIYDTLNEGGAEGSKKLDYSDLNTTMGKGYWIIVAFWQGYSPEGPGSNRWWNGGRCQWDDLCNNKGLYWSIRNIVVTAESELP